MERLDAKIRAGYDTLPEWVSGKNPQILAKRMFMDPSCCQEMPPMARVAFRLPPRSCSPPTGGVRDST